MEHATKPLWKKGVWMAVLFAVVFAAVYGLTAAIMSGDNAPVFSDAQKFLFPAVLALLISGLATLWFGIQRRVFEGSEPPGRFFFPVLSGILALVAMSLAYTWLGIWPLGSKTGMIVDMHHQYAPLLAEFRDTLLHGDSLLYTFDVGLGASYLPLIGYYLASPFNVLLLLFPARLLPEAILLITLLKNALTAALFAAAMQYIYGKRTYAIPVAALMYSMMMYLIAYSWNIMWLDAVMMLPLIVMGFERMMRTGKCLTYVLALGYTLFTNYYIGFMVCVFLVLYYLAYCVRQRRKGAEIAGSFLRFAMGSLCGGLLAMCILIPVVLALGQTSAAGGDFRTFATNFDLFDLFGRHLYDVKPTIRSGNLPNVYCGLLAVLLLPLYATTKAIPLRRRVSYLGLLGLLAVSMTINNFDLLWHGLHAPNDLPYRFSFIYCFFLLLIAYETLLHLPKISLRQVGWSVFGVLAYLVIEEKFGNEDDTFTSLYVSLALVLVYALITALASRRRLLRESVYALLLVVVAFEMVTGASATFTKLNAQEYFTAHVNYVDNDTTEAIRQAVDRMESLGNSEADGGFYRLEFLPRRTSVDTALFDYRGITVFASSNSYEETRFMGALGYAVNGVNSHLYRAFVPSCDALLGIRYVAMTAEYEPSSYLTRRDEVAVGNTAYTIYENTLALPVAYTVRPEVKDWKYSYYSPFVSQNSLFSAMTGIDRALYVFQPVETASAGANVNGTYAFSMSANQTATFDAPITTGGRVYVQVDCRAADSISVVAETAGSESGDWSVKPREPHILDAGTMQVGDRISVTISTETACSGNVYVTVLDEDALAQTRQALADGGLTVTTFTDTRVEGTLHAGVDSAVFTSIPFDKGWQVKVDGTPVETYAIGDAMLGFDVAAGEHTVTMTFFPKGLLPGLILSALGVALLVLLCCMRPRWAALTETGDDLPFAGLDDPAPDTEEQTEPAIPSSSDARPRDRFFRAAGNRAEDTLPDTLEELLRDADGADADKPDDRR